MTAEAPRPFTVAEVGGVRVVYNAPFVLTFTFICVVVYIVDMLVCGGWLHTRVFCINGYFSVLRPTSWYQLVTHCIGHVSPSHLVNNMSNILLVGTMLEDRYGTIPLATMSLITVIVTGFISVFVFKTGLLGASGIVFMFILLASFTNVRGNSLPLTTVLVSSLYVGHELYRAFQVDQVSQAAHILGGCCGAMFGYMTNGGASLQRKVHQWP